MKIRNRTFYSVWILFLMLSLTACQSNQNDISSDELIVGQEESSSVPLESIIIEMENEEVLTIETDENAEDCDFSFADLSGLEFWFSSGAGAWGTTIQIKPDGTFDGYYFDSNMGETGDGYPNGTRYECYFSGKFTSLQKIDEFEYSMKCESLLEQGVVGNSEIIDGVRVVTTGAYGFDNADEFLLYLPERKAYGLPENFLLWVGIVPDVLEPNQADSEIEDRLLFYGLYNVGGKTGFRTYSLNNIESDQ